MLKRFVKGGETFEVDFQMIDRKPTESIKFNARVFLLTNGYDEDGKPLIAAATYNKKNNDFNYPQNEDNVKALINTGTISIIGWAYQPKEKQVESKIKFVDDKEIEHEFTNVAVRRPADSHERNNIKLLVSVDDANGEKVDKIMYGVWSAKSRTFFLYNGDQAPYVKGWWLDGIICNACDGTGKVYHKPTRTNEVCDKCNGTGYLLAAEVGEPNIGN